MANNFQRKLAQISRQMPGIMKRLPGIAKVEGLRFISENFKNEGFEKTPGNYTKWPNRKSSKSKRKLIGEKRGGSLRRSWQQGTTASGNQVEFTSALPYAEVHNEGLKAGRPPGFTMPQSQMIAPSEALDKRIEKKLDSMVDQIFK